MKILFTVQGDGRGHMTQAIAAEQALERHGHEVVGVTIGTNPSRSIPEFFRRTFEGRLTPLPSPGFSFHGGRAVSTLATLRQLIRGAGDYRQSIGTLTALLEATRPDLILNFLEPLVGVFNVLRPHPIPVISVGHHFMLGHSTFVRSRRFALQRWAMRRYVSLTGAGSTKLALSFYPAQSLPSRRLFVCPPLLRRELFDFPVDQPGQYLLAYVLNQGYSQDIIRWHAANPDVAIHCFCEKPKVEPVWRFDDTLTFHKLDGNKFLRMMSESRGVACTAGFESLNEAAWLGKPLLVVPVENHVEQYLNGLDAERAGLAMTASSFDLSRLAAATPNQNGRLIAYRTWVRRAEAVLLSVVDQAARVPAPTYVPSYSNVLLTKGAV